MSAAAAVADPGLSEFEVGGRWFRCAARVDPEVLVGVMRRAQNAPTDVTDPGFQGWMETIVGFIVAATDDRDHDGLLATTTGRVQQDRDAALGEIADVFGGLLAMFVDHQLDEVRAWIVEAEARHATVFPQRDVLPVRRRSTLEDVERILAKHGAKATGRVIRPSE